MKVHALINFAHPQLPTTGNVARDADPPLTKWQKGECTRSAALQKCAVANKWNDFDKYLLTTIDNSSRILDWWCYNVSAYLVTAAVKCQFLSISATLVQSERLFSASFTKLR